MKLLTAEIKKLPAIGATEEIDTCEKILKFKFFCPWNNWKWYPVEFDGKDEFFGLVDGDFVEWGYFTLSEMESVKGLMGLKIERDLNWIPIKAKDIKTTGQGGWNAE